jgi:hypothetical protein
MIQQKIRITFSLYLYFSTYLSVNKSTYGLHVMCLTHESHTYIDLMSSLQLELCVISDNKD